MLEIILQKYFGCKRPFKQNGTLSLNGEKAYADLVDLLYSISELLGENINIDKLDEYAPSDTKNMSRFTCDL